MHAQTTYLRNRPGLACLWQRRSLQHCALQQGPPRRGGMTLVELLVVIAIIAILTTIFVPVAKNAFEGRDRREASRMINAYFAGAQARAAELGRPVCVWIERNNGDASRPGESMQLFMAEVPPPYSGDTFDARALLLDIHNRGADMQWGVTGAGPSKDDDWNGTPDDISEAGAPGSDDVPFTDGMCESALFNVNSGSLRSLVFAGDFIKFDSKGRFYQIREITNVTASRTLVSFFDPQGIYQSGVDNKWGKAMVDDDGDGATDNFSERGWAETDDVWISPPAPQHSWTPPNSELVTAGFRDPDAGWTKVPFQIIRQPRKSIVSPLTLPAGVVIDLAVSGFGVSTSSSYGFSVADARALAPESSALSNNPIVVVFNPNGSMEQVYLGGESIRPTASLHLLVGKNDQLGAANLADTNNVWVSVGHTMASLSTAENASILHGSPLPSTLLEKTIAAREYAHSKQSMGGR